MAPCAGQCTPLFVRASSKDVGGAAPSMRWAQLVSSRILKELLRTRGEAYAAHVLTTLGSCSKLSPTSPTWLKSRTRWTCSRGLP
eukprot:2452785-Pyramimonas_sp.AAC.1